MSPLPAPTAARSTASMTHAASERGGPWRLVAPWYRWAMADGSQPHRATEATKPALHKYGSTAFVADFLADPQGSMAFADVDRHQRLEQIPASELLLGGRKRFLSASRLVPTATRKLFQPAHQRHYIVAISLHCDQPGFPRVGDDSVSEVGFVIRRVRSGLTDDLAVEAAGHLAKLAQTTANARAALVGKAAAGRVRTLTPFRAAGQLRASGGPQASIKALQQVEQSRRMLQVWANGAGLVPGTGAWVPVEGRVGAWVPLRDTPEELVETTYAMRRLTVPPDDPDHPAHDGSIWWGVVPTASEEVSIDGAGRFSEAALYQLHAYARRDTGDCPGPLTWSAPSEPFRLAPFHDADGCAQRPVEIRMPDLATLQASNALPSVRVSTPPGSALEVPNDGDMPSQTKPTNATQQICFLSIPLITIIAMFVFNLFLPIVMFLFGLFWMLKLKICIPPSIELDADITAELDLEPGGIGVDVALDVDVSLDPAIATLTATQQQALHDDLEAAFNPRPGEVGEALGTALLAEYTQGAVIELLVRQGYAREAAFPAFPGGDGPTDRVRFDQVVHP